jgi:inhibitor of KinA sporulation pathway (predicted exonuclease)
VYFEAVCRDIREISNIFFTKHDQLVKKVFFNYIKCKRSPKIIKLCRGVMSSHVEAVVKIRSF